MAKVLAWKGFSFLTLLALLFSPILMVGCISTTQMQMNPWSIYSALAMAREGARGKTALEMQQVMHFPENDSLRRQSFAEGHDIFNAKDVGYVLSTANALWVEKNCPLLKNFTSDIERYYHGTRRTWTSEERLRIQER